MTLIVFFIPCYKHTTLTIIDCERFTFGHPCIVIIPILVYNDDIINIGLKRGECVCCVLCAVCCVLCV